MTILFDTGSSNLNLIDEEKLKKSLEFKRQEMNELPYLIGATGERIQLVGFIKLFVHLEEHRKKMLVLWYTTPGNNDVYLLGLSTLRHLHWLESQWPADIPEVNSDDEKKKGSQKVYEIRRKRRNTSSSDSNEEEMRHKDNQKTNYTRKREGKFVQTRMNVSSQEESDNNEADLKTFS